MNQPIAPIQQPRAGFDVRGPGAAARAKSDFADVLRTTLTESRAVQFSAHARQRAQQRHIELSSEQMQRLEQAIGQLEQKGCRQAVVLVDSTALVISVPNKTVITLMDAQELADTVFTNIDSAVLAPKTGADASRPTASLPLM